MMNGHDQNELPYIMLYSVIKVLLAEQEIDIYILNSITAEFSDIVFDSKRAEIMQLNFKQNFYPKIKYYKKFTAIKYFSLYPFFNFYHYGVFRIRLYYNALTFLVQHSLYNKLNFFYQKNTTQ